MTLNSCVTNLEVEIKLDQAPALELDYLFDGRDNIKFSKRVYEVLSGWSSLIPWIGNSKIYINASNTFPHSAGIASSASAFAALGTMVEKVSAEREGREFNFEFASSLARLGSGSACRSIRGSFNLWGKCDYPDSSNLHSIEVTGVHASFQNMLDTVCIVSSDEKLISSSEGHQTMEGHPFAEQRYAMANSNTLDILRSLREGDWKSFGHTLEQEALCLHSLMMSARKPFILLSPSALAIINKVWSFREETKLDLYFTIDAGPNIHLLYPDGQKEVIQKFIYSELRDFCEDGRVIEDRVGLGVKID